MAASLVNGESYAWATVQFAPFGVPMVGITKVSYKTKQNKTNNMGAGVYPISRGYGNYEYDGSIEVYLEEWRAIIASAIANDPLQIPWFDIPVTFGNSLTNLQTDVLRSVDFLEDPFDSKQGDTKTLITIPLLIGRIDHTTF